MKKLKELNEIFESTYPPWDSLKEDLELLPDEESKQNKVPEE